MIAKCRPIIHWTEHCECRSGHEPLHCTDPESARQKKKKKDFSVCIYNEAMHMFEIKYAIVFV